MTRLKSGGMVVTAALIAAGVLATTHQGIQSGSQSPVGPQGDGSIIVPTHQTLRPAGFQVVFPGRPVDLALSPDEKLLAIKNWKSLDLLRVSDRVVLQSLPYPKSGAAFTGLCWSPDGRRIYVTEAEDRVRVAELSADSTLHWVESLVIPKLQGLTPPGVSEPITGDPAPGGLAIRDDGSELLVTLSRYNSLAVISLPGGRVRYSPVGIAPYEVVLFSKEKAYVSNWGGRRPKAGETTGPSSGSAVLVDPGTGIASSGSISVVDLRTGEAAKSLEVGLHPSGMALNYDRSRLFVACANSDIVAVIDTESDEVVENISVRIDPNLPFGSAPNALAVTPDGGTLLVANGADNAVGVISLGRRAGGKSDESRIEGFIPTAWYPGSIVLDRAARFIFVANVKGLGSRNQRTDRPGYNSHDHLGSVSIIRMPSAEQLAEYTRIVQENNGLRGGRTDVGVTTRGSSEPVRVPVPTGPGELSHFEHVLYIIKENRTYDQIFGDLPQGNGDPSLLLFGREVTPNHHALAESFVLLDNFYCSGVLSADGHQWTDEAYVTDYLEKSFGDWVRSYPYDGDDALAYASSGFIWDNVLRHGLTFRNYGEFVRAEISPADAGFSDIYADFVNGTRRVSVRAVANLATLGPYICPTFVGFPNSVPDVYRAKEFIKELNDFEEQGNLPNFMIMLLPNDHTSGTRPGRPTPRAAIADNDLALGRIVEAVSRSRFWPKTCILVTEDDPQAGLDHVDSHRTVGLVISPYTKRGQVISTRYTQISMVRTIENILGIPPMNQFDLAAEPMVDCFAKTPDWTPYRSLPNQIPLDELNPPLEALSGPALHWAQKSLEEDLSDVDRIEEQTFNRIIWHAVKGYDVPYPADVNAEE